MPTALFAGLDPDGETLEQKRISPLLKEMDLNEEKDHTVSQKPIAKKEERRTSLSRLSTHEEHINFLKDAIHKAHHSIFIVSYGIRGEVAKELYAPLKTALSRGVKVDIYNSRSGSFDEDALNVFYKLGLKYNETNTHAKILTVDDTLVSVGSFNWLGTSKKYKKSLNGSLVLKNIHMNDLKGQIWDHLKKYLPQSQEKENNNQSNDLGKTLKWEEKDGVAYLNSLSAHRLFIKNALEKAKRRIIFCSPFVNKSSEYFLDFTKKKLFNALKRGVEISFVVNKTDQNLPSLKTYLGYILKHTNFHLIEKTNFHLKTAIVDNSITESSFNWLSASRKKESCYHNHEASLVYEGKAAQPFIKAFLDSFNLV